MMRRLTLRLFALALLVLLLATCAAPMPFGTAFDGDRAYADVLSQLAFGARHPGTPGHAQTIAWIQQQVELASWDSEVQQLAYSGVPINNVIAYSQEAPAKPWIILGAHYDTREFADQETDPDSARQPVPGANDGASGVAVLTELARVMPHDIREHVWLVFFDYEDNGGIDGLDWALGSRAFVEQLEEHPDAVIIVDMIGDADLNVYYEVASDDALNEEIWAVAAELGVEQFIPQQRFHMLDDHTAFLMAGIPAIDIIDFDYPYWHTVEDTADKVSAESLSAIGRVLLAWLEQAVP